MFNNELETGQGPIGEVEKLTLQDGTLLETQTHIKKGPFIKMGLFTLMMKVYDLNK